MTPEQEAKVEEWLEKLRVAIHEHAEAEAIRYIKETGAKNDASRRILRREGRNAADPEPPAPDGRAT